jgi:hypothetical protein
MTMARHRPKWTCAICGRRQVKFNGAVCWSCLQIEPKLPPLPRPAAKAGDGR